MKNKKAVAPLFILVVFFVIVASLFSLVGLFGAIKFALLDWEKIFIFMGIIIGLMFLSKVFSKKKS